MTMTDGNLCTSSFNLKKKKNFLTSFFSAGDRKKTVLKRRRGNSNRSFFLFHLTNDSGTNGRENDRTIENEGERTKGR